jgi:hypothetical protein
LDSSRLELTTADGWLPRCARPGVKISGAPAAAGAACVAPDTRKLRVRGQAFKSDNCQLFWRMYHNALRRFGRALAFRIETRFAVMASVAGGDGLALQR